ncbi:MAG: hypothetical protein UT34_C0002G0318 [candidate division WS6 bacterium GW2011_GWF2_39_15]|uniref:Uncharacterized protein n=1 Tax=candidate division WS6 bacterium GW2011_GWF2_39_15 TaxID=1619100 RepID=A0A0G0MZ17_9BACT|nr:MAG: hypothetical protein UT34_C0002G0318 [candidate division WS6 bacterium GW2011_GWF2_39_15]
MKKYRFVILGLVIIVVLGVIFLPKILNSHEKETPNNSLLEKVTDLITKAPEPTLIKSLPIDIQPYNPKTGMAGDFLFTKKSLFFDTIYQDYGFYIPGNSENPAKNNPQPTFFAPLGTKVHSIIDGVVTNISTLYSDDYSIAMTGDNTSSPYIFELEHVINPTVKVGDKVKAGDIVAEVSDYMSFGPSGQGLVEIGLLLGGKTPKHVCPYLHLHPENKDEITNKLTRFYKDWNEYMGKEIYDLSGYTTVGCLTTEDIEG